MMFKSVLVAAACVGAAIAQANLAFTGFPSAQQPVGQPVELKWEGGNGSPVTIALRRGDPNNLQDVAILTTSATGGSYTWVPSASLSSGSDYALQISQSGGSPNYYGPFTLTGGSLSSASITQSASSALSSASSALSSASSLLSSITSNSTSTASNSTVSTRATPSSSATRTPTGSSTGGSATSTGGSTGAASAGASSPIALILGAVAAMLYLN